MQPLRCHVSDKHRGPFADGTDSGQIIVNAGHGCSVRFDTDWNRLPADTQQQMQSHWQQTPANMITRFRTVFHSILAKGAGLLHSLKPPPTWRHALVYRVISAGLQSYFRRSTWFGVTGEDVEWDEMSLPLHWQRQTSLTPNAQY